jgi:hypothetical protein
VSLNPFDDDDNDSDGFGDFDDYVEAPTPVQQPSQND